MIVARSLAFSVFFYLWTIGLAVLYLPLLALPRRYIVGGARIWQKGTLFLLAHVVGLKWQAVGLENVPKGAVIFAAKHQSAWDTIIFHVLFPDPAFILKKELLYLPLIGWYLLKHRMIPVDRKAGARAMKEMVREAGKAIEDGRQIVIFPEGTRSAVGQKTAYHPGIALLYASLNVPVVPVALNSGLFWKRQGFLKKSGMVTIQFLPPMPANLDRRVFMTALEEKIETVSQSLYSI